MTLSVLIQRRKVVLRNNVFFFFPVNRIVLEDDCTDIFVTDPKIVYYSLLEIFFHFNNYNIRKFTENATNATRCAFNARGGRVCIPQKRREVKSALYKQNRILTMFCQNLENTENCRFSHLSLSLDFSNQNTVVYTKIEVFTQLFFYFFFRDTYNIVLDVYFYCVSVLHVQHMVACFEFDLSCQKNIKSLVKRERGSTVRSCLKSVFGVDSARKSIQHLKSNVVSQNDVCLSVSVLCSFNIQYSQTCGSQKRKTGKYQL